MADRKISDLTALTTPASGDYLPIVDISESAAASKNKRITIQSLFQGVPVNVGIGTSSPRGLLSISNNVIGTGVVDSSLHLGYSASDNYGFRIVNSNDPYDTSAGLLKFQRGTVSSWVDSVVIDNLGNVGIGTSSQYNKLYVKGSQATDPLLSTTVGPVVALNSTNNADTWALQTVLSLYRDGKEGVTYGNQVNFNLGRYSQLGSASQTQLTLRLTQGNLNEPEVDVLTLLSSGNVGIGISSPTTLLDVNADTVRVRTARTPASATATGATGEICWDANYIYVCIATNTWKRAALSTW